MIHLRNQTVAQLNLEDTIMSFMTDIQEQIAFGIATINEYGLYFKDKTKEWASKALTHATYYKDEALKLMATVAESIKQGFQFSHGKLKYFITNLPTLIRQASNQVWQWLVKGFTYGFEAIKAFPTKLNNFAKGLYQWLKWGVEIGKWLGKKIFFGFKDFIVSFVKGMWELACNIGTFLKEATVALAREIFNFFKNLPQNLIKIYHFLKDAFIYLKDLVIESVKLAYRIGKYLIQSLPKIARGLYRFGVELIKFLGECLKEIGRALLNLAKKGLKAVLLACKNIFIGILKKLSLGLGMVYGISAALVGLGMDSISAFSAKYLGLQLAQHALFNMTGIGLSLALSCFILYQLARVSLYTLSSVLALSFLKKSKAKDIVEAPKEKAAPEAAPEIALEERPKALLNQYSAAQRPDEISEENPLDELSEKAVNDAQSKIKKAV